MAVDVAVAVALAVSKAVASVVAVVLAVAVALDVTVAVPTAVTWGDGWVWVSVAGVAAQEDGCTERNGFGSRHTGRSNGPQSLNGHCFIPPSPRTCSFPVTVLTTIHPSCSPQSDHTCHSCSVE